MTDSRQRAEKKKRYRLRTMCACRIFSLRRRVAFAIACHVSASCSLVLNTSTLHNFAQQAASHATRAPSRFSWRSPRWSSKCDALLEIIHIIRCKSFVCCAYFLNNRSVVGASISSTQKVLEVLLLSTPKKYCG